jgi:polysaccharide biosynthesis/export protein
MKVSWISATALVFWPAVQIWAQADSGVQPSAPVTQAPKSPEPPGQAPAAADKHPINYVLGPEDQITIRVLDAEEISDKPMQIGSDGFVTVPMVGRIQAGGLTVAQFEAELAKKLETFIKDPQLSVFVSEYRSEPVSVVGAVNSAGVVQLRGKRTLMEVISLAGGLRADAGNTVTITREASRGAIALPGASSDSTGKFSIAQVNLGKIMEAKDPRENISIEPNDVIAVSRAQMVYVVGEVGKPGGFVMNDRETVSALQALALAGGLGKAAAPNRAKVLRSVEGKPDRVEITADLRSIMQGKTPDIQLHADDILFVPNSAPRSAGARIAEAAINAGTGVAIWRIP